MAQINNFEIVDKIRRLFKLSASENIPNSSGESVNPVLIANPDNFTKVLGSLTRTTTAAAPGATILTSHATKETYITGIDIAITSDVLADNVAMNVRVTINGALVILTNLNKQTLTITNNEARVMFPIPIKIDKGSVVTLVNVFTAGASRTDVSILGYEIEPF